MKRIYIILVMMFVVITENVAQSLKGLRICIDPGHGGTALTDSYRVGINGEREEWVNLRVAQYLEKLLRDEGAEIKMTRTEDVFVELADRARQANDFAADLFISIHHNGTADTTVNYPVIYFHGSKLENKASVYFGELLVKELHEKLFLNGTNKYSIVSDYLIFPGRGAAVLRGTYGIPAIIGEASYFTNPTEEMRLKNDSYNRQEAFAYYFTIKKFFGLKERQDILNKGSVSLEIPKVEVNQEAARMNSDAWLWSSKIDFAVGIIESKDVGKYEEAKACLLDVMRLFPDNYRVQTMYESLLEVLKRLGNKELYDLIAKRYENYVFTIN